MRTLLLDDWTTLSSNFRAISAHEGAKSKSYVSESAQHLQK